MNKFDALYSKIKRGLVTEAYFHEYGQINPPGTNDPLPFDGDIILTGDGGVEYYISIALDHDGNVSTIYDVVSKGDLVKANRATLSLDAEDKLIEMGCPEYDADDPEFPSKYAAWAKTADPAKLNEILSEDGIFETLSSENGRSI